ncbi:hypothetical protein OCK74_20185 [Chitinophagaceae bacterium LB-8]|uniref:Uncharacterized protein n=1 Tax=Paraflavisolibacter caeni TaxID=2982496 RepID=A0A9X3B9L3_9BACT|nr:hypothetical protein [Paraflavisolibacter caeni]MCU7551451.1 hypothetical protein [Paraflavisolibacter caeni]
MNERKQYSEEQNQNERNQQQTEQQKIAVNPNPRANENVQQTGFNQEKEQSNEQVGSEITDGEDA